MIRRSLATAALVACAASAAQAQVKAAPSTRATAEVTLSAPRVQGQPAPTPLKIRIDYGQPHARGRKVMHDVVKLDEVWRLGANAATEFSTDVDLVLGGATIPKGKYTLFTLPTKAGWKLIVNKKTGEWGTEYDASADLVKVDLKARTLAEPVESLQITLVPGDGAKGTLTIAWGTALLSTEWAAK
jgi:hypothetical protein